VKIHPKIIESHFFKGLEVSKYLSTTSSTLLDKIPPKFFQ